MVGGDEKEEKGVVHLNELVWGRQLGQKETSSETVRVGCLSA